MSVRYVIGLLSGIKEIVTDDKLKYSFGTLISLISDVAVQNTYGVVDGIYSAKISAVDNFTNIFEDKISELYLRLVTGFNISINESKLYKDLFNNSKKFGLDDIINEYDEYIKLVDLFENYKQQLIKEYTISDEFKDARFRILDVQPPITHFSEPDGVWSTPFYYKLDEIISDFSTALSNVIYTKASDKVSHTLSQYLSIVTNADAERWKDELNGYDNVVALANFLDRQYHLSNIASLLDNFDKEFVNVVLSKIELPDSMHKLSVNWANNLIDYIENLSKLDISLLDRTNVVEKVHNKISTITDNFSSDGKFVNSFFEDMNDFYLDFDKRYNTLLLMFNYFGSLIGEDATGELDAMKQLSKLIDIKYESLFNVELLARELVHETVENFDNYFKEALVGLGKVVNTGDIGLTEGSEIREFFRKYFEIKNKLLEFRPVSNYYLNLLSEFENEMDHILSDKYTSFITQERDSNSFYETVVDGLFSDISGFPELKSKLILVANSIRYLSKEKQKAILTAFGYKEAPSVPKVQVNPYPTVGSLFKLKELTIAGAKKYFENYNFDWYKDILNKILDTIDDRITQLGVPFLFDDPVAQVIYNRAKDGFKVDESSLNEISDEVEREIIKGILFDECETEYCKFAHYFHNLESSRVTSDDLPEAIFYLDKYKHKLVNPNKVYDIIDYVNSLDDIIKINKVLMKFDWTLDNDMVSKLIVKTHTLIQTSTEEDIDSLLSLYYEADNLMFGYKDICGEIKYKINKLMIDNFDVYIKNKDRITQDFFDSNLLALLHSIVK